MSELSKSRVSTAIAVVAAIVAVVAVALPGVGFGQTPTIHGGTPTDVFMTSTPGFCATVDGFGGPVIQEEVTVDASSNLLVYYTFEWGNLDARLEGLVDIALQDADGAFVAGQGEWGFSGGSIPRTSGTVMWSFEDIPPGTYTAFGAARVDALPSGGPQGQGGSDLVGSLNDCALTVFVIPPA